jgi:LPXTG-motif cell wall-anchored protein
MTPKPIVQPRVSYTPNPVPAAPIAEPIPEPYPAAEPTAAEPEILVAEVAAAEPTATVPQELPKTATAVPTMALGGLTSLLAGLGIALLRRRVN